MTTKTAQSIVFSDTETPAIYLAAASLSGIEISADAAFDGKTADLYSSSDNVNFYPVYDILGEKYTIVLGSGRHIYLDIPVTAASIWIKLVASASLNGKNIKLITRDV